MASEYDDIVEKQQGIFGADSGGLCPEVYGNRDKVEVNQAPEGVYFSFSCPRCHLSKQIMAEYPERLSIQHGVSPHVAFNGMNVVRGITPWNFDQENAAWFPDVSCTSSTCGQPMPMLISMPEAARYTQVAQQRGWFPAKHQLDQHLKTIRAQQGYR